MGRGRSAVVSWVGVFLGGPAEGSTGARGPSSVTLPAADTPQMASEISGGPAEGRGQGLIPRGFLEEPGRPGRDSPPLPRPPQPPPAPWGLLGCWPGAVRAESGWLSQACSEPLAKSCLPLAPFPRSHFLGSGCLPHCSD